MIINKVAPYWTEEEKERLEILHRAQDEIINSAGKRRKSAGKATPDLLDEWAEIEGELSALEGNVELRYIKDRGKSGLLEDASEIVSAIEQEDYLKDLRGRIETLTKMREAGLAEEGLRQYGQFAAEGFDTCMLFILRALRVQLNGVADSNEDKESIYDLAGNRAELWYKAPPETVRGNRAGTAGIDVRQPLELIKEFGFMADKINSQLLITDAFTEDIDGQVTMKWAVNQAAKERNKAVPVYIGLTYEGDDIKINKRMTAFDKAVYEAVSTAHHYHQKKNPGKALYITPQEIWRIMNGTASTNKTPGEKQVQKVCNSLDKMRFTRVYMDISRELEARYISLEDERITEGKIDTYLLKAEKVTFATTKGKKAEGYSIAGEPILYSYNSAKGRLVLVPYEMLDTSAATGNEGNTVEIRNYLLQQIGLMYEGNGRNSNRILYSTIYEQTGIQSPEERVARSKYKTDNAYRSAIRKERKKDIDKISKLLNAWTDKGWILGSVPVEKRGVDILLNDSLKRTRKKLPDSK